MATFNPSKKVATDFNKGNQYKNGDGVQAETINNLVENQLYLQENIGKVDLSKYSTTTEMNNAISYAVDEAIDGAVPISRTINNKALNKDITLSASDVGALPSTTVIPSISYEKKFNGDVIQTGKLTINGVDYSINSARTIYSTKIYDEDNRFQLGSIGNGGTSWAVYAPNIIYTDEYQLLSTKIGTISYGGKEIELHTPKVQYNKNNDIIKDEHNNRTLVGTLMYGITENNVYVPNATTANEYGLVKVGKATNNSIITVNDYTEANGRYYQVESVNGKLIVNVPWVGGNNDIDLSNYVTKDDLKTATDDFEKELAKKQDTLTAGQNISIDEEGKISSETYSIEISKKGTLSEEDMGRIISNYKDVVWLYDRYTLRPAYVYKNDDGSIFRYLYSVTTYLYDNQGNANMEIYVCHLDDDGGYFVSNNSFIVGTMASEDVFHYYTKTETESLLREKQDALTVGNNITIENGVISAEVDLSNYYNKTEVGTEISNAVKDKVDTSVYDEKIEQIEQSLDGKQPTLTSSTVLGKINGKDFKYGGSIEIEGGGGLTEDQVKDIVNQVIGEALGGEY